MPRPGFTILELVIAVGLLMLIGALAAPALSSRIAESRFETAQTEVEETLVMGRVDAQREGRSIAVRALESRGGVALTAEALEPLPGTDSGPAREAHIPLRGLHVMIAGLRITDERPTAQPRSDAGSFEELDLAPEAEARPVTLAVFLPDGSARTSGATYLVQVQAGVPTRAVELRVNRWTGMPSFAQVDLSAPDTATEEEELAPPEPAGEQP